MLRIDLPSPVKRDRELPYSEFSYEMEDHLYLPFPSDIDTIPFFDVIKARKSARDFATIDLPTLSTLLWFTAKTVDTKKEAGGYIWQHRPTPSAGGRHPIDILITNQSPDRDAFYLYDPIAHALCQLARPDEDLLEELLCDIETVLPIGRATIFCFVAQFDRTLAKYEGGESLVWRDSGALLAMFYLVAEALGLNCCGLGITGEPWVSRFSTAGESLKGVGGCLCGKAKSHKLMPS